jgi:hypothetical protein
MYVVVLYSVSEETDIEYKRMRITDENNGNI